MSGRYATYEELVPSGEPWLGEVPSHWRVVRLKTTFGIRKHIAGYVGPDVLSVTQRGLKKKDLTSGDGQLSMDYSKYQIVSVGDFVMNHMDLLTGFVDIARQGGVTSPDYRVFLPRTPSAVEPRYFLYIFQLCYANRIFFPLGQGSAQLGRWRLPRRPFEEFLLPTPEIEEQTQIAAFLDYETARIDTLIDKQEQLIALLKEKRHAVISHVVTKGLNPAAPMRDSGVEWLGEVPAHWQECPLGALFGLKHGYPFDSSRFTDAGALILMTPGNFRERGGFRHKVPEKFYGGSDFPEEFILKAGDLLVAMTEQAPGLLGSALFVPECGTYLHNQRLGLVQNLKTDLINVRYLYHLFNSSRYRAEIGSHVTGATVRHTSPKKIRAVRVWLPPLVEQHQIASFLSERIATFDALNTSTVQTVALLRERRTALISAAVTGKIDVRNWKPPGSADPTAQAEVA